MRRRQRRLERLEDMGSPPRILIRCCPKREALYPPTAPAGGQKGARSEKTAADSL